MILKFFRNSFIVFILVCIGYSPVFYFNIYEDPYSIFRFDYSNVRIEPNNHFIKMRFLLNKKNSFDSFIFGNSRANNVNPTLFTNGKYYNFYYSLGIPAEYKDDLRRFLKHKIKIKNLLILLDYSSYSSGSGNRDLEMLRWPYPTGKLDILKKHVSYAFQIPNKSFKSEYYNTPASDIYKKIFITGQAENKTVEDYIEANKLKHINDPKFNYPYLGWTNLVDQTIQDLDTIKKLCIDNQIKVTFVLNPIHKTTYLANNPSLYYEFMKKLSNITDFYDFGGINKVTSNNYFYYETSHFRPMIGQAISRYIQYNEKIDSIPNFGTYITKQNINTRIDELSKQQ